MARVLMAAYTNYRRDPRVRREAETLVEAGHRVTFLARRQNGEPDRENLCGVDVIKFPGLVHARTSIGGYLIDYAIFFILLMLHLTLRPRRYQLVHVNNMPDFLVFAAWLPRLLGIPLIHDVHDLMPELYREKFAPDKEHWLLRALTLQECWAGRFASAVLTVEERLKDILARRGIPREKIHVLMNLPDERIFAPSRTGQAAGRSLRRRLPRHARASPRSGHRDRGRCAGGAGHPGPRAAHHRCGRGTRRARRAV
jgi:glycosyltransferase involved in cell wall biosynthesis